MTDNPISDLVCMWLKRYFQFCQSAALAASSRYFSSGRSDIMGALRHGVFCSVNRPVAYRIENGRGLCKPLLRGRALFLGGGNYGPLVGGQIVAPWPDRSAASPRHSRLLRKGGVQGSGKEDV